MTAVVILGVSGAGKDSLAAALGQLTPVVNLKFSRPMKNMLEQVYGLEPGSLEDRQFRQQKMPGHPDGITWNDVMVRCFHHFPAIDPMMMIQNIRRQLITIPGNIIKVFTDCRNPVEIAVIDDYRLTYGDDLHLVLVTRPSTKRLASDVHLERNFKALVSKAQSSHIFSNSGDLTKLHLFAKELTYAISITSRNRSIPRV